MESNQSKQSRRGFIKKAAVGAALTSLPVKSVWATNSCSMSGQLSGNLSQTSGTTQPLCDTPILSGGRSHGFWYQGGQTLPGSNGNSIKNVFPQMGSNPSNTTKDCWRTMVATVRDTTKLGINSSLALELNVSTNITLTQAFQHHGNGSGILRQGATAYLNTYFELYNGIISSGSAAQSRMAAEEVANMVMNRMYLDSGWGTDSDLGYTNGYSKAPSSSFLFSGMNCSS